MKFILGKKIGMTQVYKGDNIVPVTLIESGPNFVSQIKTKEPSFAPQSGATEGKKDGYSAVQIGFGEAKKINKPKTGHLKNLPKLRWLREFRVDSSELKLGDQIDVSIFAPGDKVNIMAISKGKGFQGVVKRHGFHGGPKSHGQKDRLRAPGSIGASWPQHVIKGMRMAGRMGGDKITVKNVEIIEVDKENNIIALRGAVPGRRGTLVMIKS
ncbi:MAG: 50S ribosomal protein L3 [Candidatus Azambacteria bacterium]|nr:50S ribosomal protein L3 [Candidatus Azambacteria bacterium]